MFHNRYEELLDLVSKEKPRTILEVGTWNGHRAIQMCTAVNASYVGFDLFDTATPDTDAVEKNVKKHSSAAEVSKLLTQFHIRHCLIKGNTRVTLPTYWGQVDFAFIDGGHSVETIRSDWWEVKRLIKPNGLVVFDDWYEGVDTSLWGANQIVDPLNPTFSQSADRIVGGGFTRLAWVRV